MRTFTFLFFSLLPLLLGCSVPALLVLLALDQGVVVILAIMVCRAVTWTRERLLRRAVKA